MIRRLSVSACLAASLVAGCTDSAQKPQQEPARVEGQAVVFPAGSPQTAALLSAEVEPRREAVLRFNGRLVWDEERTVRVFSPLAGRVQAVAARPGDAVRPGQLLAVVSAPDLGAAQSEARKSEQDDLLARYSLARVSELVEAGVAPAKDLQAAQAEAARAAAERARALAKLRLYGAGAGAVDQRFNLTAPIGGVVVERNLNPGQELRADGQPERGLYVISDPARLWFVLDVSEAEAGSIRTDAEVRIGATLLGEERIAGRVAHVSDVVDPQTRTVKVRGTVENPGRRLKAEMFITAELKVPAARGFIVPTRAVYLRGEQSYVFVESGGGRYLRKPVKLGPTSNGHQVVLEGLEAGEKVVVDGSLLLERLLASRD